MRIRSILAALTLTAAILIGGTGTAAAQSQPLPNGRCLVDNALDSVDLLDLVAAVVLPDREIHYVDPCTVADNGQVL